MLLLLTVTLPVFLVLGFGYLAAWRGWIGENAIDGVMKFSQSFAIPCLLFLAIARLDLGQEFDLTLLGSFYAGALAGFFAGLFGARLIFGRSWEDAVAIGFVGLFSNSLLLGLPITERAYGADALQANFAIIALHSPFCYAVGITAMELARAQGKSLRQLPLKVLRGMASLQAIQDRLDVEDADEVDLEALGAEGTEVSVPARGPVRPLIHDMLKHLCSSISYAGASSLAEARQQFWADPERFLVRLSASSRRESYER